MCQRNAMDAREMNHTTPTGEEREPVGSPAGIFDLSNAEGVNESERLLMRLCRKSFLSLWAHANLHTAQDMRGGKGSAKEFADVLVVFGNDVIIFSDKHIGFQTDRELGTAWPRWFKRAVIESAKQLHGAMNWLKRFPDRVFLDAACSRPLTKQFLDWNPLVGQQWVSRWNSDNNWVAPYGLRDDTLVLIRKLSESRVVQSTAQSLQLHCQGHFKQADLDVRFLLPALRQQSGEP